MAAVDSYQNGGKYINDMDADNPEYQRQMMRPVEVKEDVRQMEERKRVKQILHSQAFCEELQELVLEQFHPSVVAVRGLNSSAISSTSAQQLTDLIMPHARATLMRKGAGPCIPIADVKELDLMDYDKGERQFRCRLASLYRLIDLFGWSHGIQSYITGRINQDFEHFLVAPYGMLHHEVTASSLVKVDMRGEVLDPGSTTLGVNKTGFSLHSAIYASRPDIKSVIHVRCTPAVSISAMNAGLLPLCPEAMIVGDVSFVEYNGGFLDLEQRDKLRRAIGPINKVFILRNFGIIVGGETIEEAFYLIRNVMIAVDYQLMQIRAGGLSGIVLPSDEEKHRVQESARQLRGVGEGGRKYHPSEEEFEMLMRHLDNSGYRTGYLYRDHADEKSDKPSVQATSDVAIPPTTTSFNYCYDEEGRVASPVKGRPGSSQGGKIKKGSQQQHRQDFSSAGISSSYSGRSDQGLDDTSALDTTKTSKWVPEDTSTPIKPDLAGARKEMRQERQLETTMTEERYAAENRATVQAQPGSPQKSTSSAEGVLHDREPSAERSQPPSGRETPGSKDKKKKKSWFGSKKKE